MTDFINIHIGDLVEVDYNVSDRLRPLYMARMNGVHRALVVDHGHFLWDWNKYLVLCFVDEVHGQKHKKVKIWHNQIGNGDANAPTSIRVIGVAQ
jgi:hypothetical protein